MIANETSSLRRFVLLASLPIAVLSGYVAWIVVPEVLRVVVPAVVEAVIR